MIITLLITLVITLIITLIITLRSVMIITLITLIITQRRECNYVCNELHHLIGVTPGVTICVPLRCTAERIVARGCAHAHIHGRGRARRGSSKASALHNPHPTARLRGGENAKTLFVF